MVGGQAAIPHCDIDVHKQQRCVLDQNRCLSLVADNENPFLRLQQAGHLITHTHTHSHTHTHTHAHAHTHTHTPKQNQGTATTRQKENVHTKIKVKRYFPPNFCIKRRRLSPVSECILTILTSSSPSKLHFQSGPGRPGKPPLTTHDVRVGHVPHVVTHGSPLARVVQEHGARGASATPDESDVPVLPAPTHLALTSARLLGLTPGRRHGRWAAQGRQQADKDSEGDQPSHRHAGATALWRRHGRCGLS